MEHADVYTAGKRTEEVDRPKDGTPVIDVDRGGKITWHGPGQLVGYPIVKLAEPVDVGRAAAFLASLLATVSLCCGALAACTPRPNGPEPTAEEFFEALATGDTSAAAQLADDPEAARAALRPASSPWAAASS